MRLALISTILAALLFPLGGCHYPKSTPSVEEPHDQTDALGHKDAEEASVPPPKTVAIRNQPVDTTAGDHRPVLVCFGDSLTAGAGTDSGQSYPDYLQKDLDQLGYKYHVVNLGISGNTTKDGVARLPDVLALHPEVTVVEFGGNDGLRGLPLTDTRKNLEAIVEDLQKAGVKVALAGITLPPDYGAAYIRQFDAMYTQVARKYKVPMLPFLLKNVYGVPGMMQRDETHATAQGNQIVAENVTHLVEPILQK
jgi:acyl-CoA thioesterase-1